MKILIGTTNQNKVDRIKNLLREHALEIYSLKDLDYEIPEPDENQENALEIAKYKAWHYYQHTREKVPVLTQDDTMILEGVIDEDQPGSSIKTPVATKYGKATDENIIKYYSRLAQKYGGSIRFKFVYGHGFCDGIKLEGATSFLPGKLVSEPKLDGSKNYAINSVMQIEIGGKWKYYSDATQEEKVEADFRLKNSIIKLLCL